MAAKPRRRRLAKFFGQRPDPRASTNMQLAPRRLEPRRMLDAAAGALALEMFDASSEFVQAGSDFAPLALSTNEAAVGANSSPANIQIQSMGSIDENGVATLELVFEDADPLDSHTVEVDWGDGPVEVFNVPAGSQFFGTTHQYMDDDPSVTSSDVYTVNVKVIDAAGDFAEASAPVTVNNLAPSNLQIAPPAPIDENGIGTLELTFDDPGSLDSHTVEVDWGDGSAVEVFNVPQGSRFFGTTHQYLDDDPTGTSADDYTINVRVLDDDGGEIAGSTTINVSNIAPSNVQIAPMTAIDENGLAKLNLTFDDPGTLDAHKVEVDWGDGTVETLNVAPGSRAFSASHQYLDDDPTGTSSDSYAVQVRLLDDDLGEVTAAPVSVTVNNVAPSAVMIDPLAPIDENGVAVLNLAFTDPGTLDAHMVEIDWGDGSPLEVLPVAAGARVFSANHQYLDDNPTGTASDSYSIKVRLLDDDLGAFTANAVVLTVNNVAPANVQVLPTVTTSNEGALVNLTLMFDDPGSLDTHTYEVDWGDGATATVGAAVGHSIAASHTYADDGAYTVKVKIVDDDGGVGTATATVNVANVAPTLTVVGNQTVNEGSQLSLTNIGAFTDPGFDNPLNVLDPANGGETLETFTYTINWGDGTANSAGSATIDVMGGVGTPTSGSFDGQHTYADNGVYTVTVTVFDDDGGQDQRTFQVTVSNVAPTLAVVGNQTVNEGAPLLLANIGAFTDPGFNNPLNPLPGGELSEAFTYTINWGDGTTNSAGAATVDVLGNVGTPTSGSFDGLHTYADNGVYAVTVTVFDDDGGEHQQSFQVTVANVAPTLTVVGNQSVNEGSQLSLTNIGSFTDPGFNNPLNPLPGGETTETFTFTVNWGDGTANSAGAATVDVLGGVGTPTSGSFDGLHTYADNGVYTVTVTVFDDDGGQHLQTFQVTVLNIAPTLTVVGNQSVDEGSQLSLTNIGSFTDPGFNNSLNPLPGGETTETFTFTINWGDGTAASTGAATVDVLGNIGLPTAGSFDGQHTYADNGVYTVSVTVFDDDGGQHLQTFLVTVQNVAPTLQASGNQTINEGSALSLVNVGTFTDPGFNNPLNPLPGGETAENFTFTINWGDGTAADNGAATVDVLGAIGTPTSGSFDGLHTYADNGVYTVTVTVFDDDGGQHQNTFQVTVLNVAPTLGVVPDQTTNEGSLLSLVNIGALTDPGFNNPLNPLPDGETTETFTFTINWGDGTANSAGAATVDVLGGVGTLTAASFDGSHHYADDGVYTVTVTVLDDDGGQDVKTFLVTVNNVAPTLNLTVDASLIDAIDEGGITEVNITGLFSDPGFDNPNNTALFPGNATPETEETFTYEVDWGDGETETFSLADLNGGPGVESTGSISQFFTHQYIDNDLDGVRDARYTVTVTVFDDDGGSNAKTFEVIVYNTNPTLAPIAATSVNTEGETTLTLTFDDLGAPGVESFEILIDWGDQLTNPNPVERFVVEDTYDASTPNTFTFTHKYSGPPDPLHPAADIVISVKIQDDDFGTLTSRPDADPFTVDGESNIETVAITNPGLGAEPFRIDTTPQVAILTFPERVAAAIDLVSAEVRGNTVVSGDEGGSAGDSRATSERYLELRVINPDGSLGEGYRLPSAALNNLQALFRKLPDNHYAIYLVQSETNVRRLVIDVFVRNGKVIDPGDDSEGARDRPPTDEATTAPAEVLPEELPAADDGAATSSAVEPKVGAKVGPPLRHASSTAVYHRTALAGVALALSGAGRDWQQQIEQALVKAKPSEWKRLRTAGHRRKRKPR